MNEWTGYFMVLVVLRLHGIYFLNHQIGTMCKLNMYKKLTSYIYSCSLAWHGTALWHEKYREHIFSLVNIEKKEKKRVTNKDAKQRAKKIAWLHLKKK